MGKLAYKIIAALQYLIMLYYLHAHIYTKFKYITRQNHIILEITTFLYVICIFNRFDRVNS